MAAPEPSSLTAVPRRQGLTRLSQAEEYKADQLRQWEAAAGHLGAWWPGFERLMAPVTRAMVTHARLRPDGRVLDVATGFGEPALTLARRVVPSGRVVATDLSPAMLAVAAERARVAGVTNVSFATMDAEDPAPAEAGFDAVTCRLGLMFLPHLDVALERLSGLLAPGGRLVAAVWGRAEANPWLTGARRTLAEFLELPPPPPGSPDVFSLAGPRAAPAALARAGFHRIRRRRVVVRASWSGAEAYAAFHRDGPMSRMVADESPDRQAEAWRQVAAGAARRWGPGPIRLPGEVLVVSGRRR